MNQGLLNDFYALYLHIQSLQHLYEVLFVFLILQMMRLRYKEVK